MKIFVHEGCPEGGPAVYTLIQCTPLLVEKAGVAPDQTLRFTIHKQVSVHAREPPGFETHGEGHTKSKIGGISGPTNGPWSDKNFKKNLLILVKILYAR